MTRGRLGVVLGALLVVGLAAPASVSADVVDDNPAAVSRFAGDTQVFARGADGTIYTTTRTAGGWTDWASLGGQTDSGPAAVVYGNDVWVFARGPGGELIQRSATNPSAWVSLGGSLASAPAATVVRGTDRLFVFARHTDDQVWYRIFAPGSGWLPWTPLGGTVTSAPAAVSRIDLIIDLFARASGGEIVQRALVGNEWLPWDPRGNTASSAPSATTQRPTNVEIFTRGSNGVIWRQSWNANAWGSWAPIDATVVTSGPAAVADGAGRLSVFARTGSTVSVTDLVGGSWTAWSSLGAVGPAPSCFAPATPNGGPRLSVSIKPAPGVKVKGSGKSAKVRFGQKAKLKGKVRSPEGEPLAGARVCVGVRRDVQGAKLVHAKNVTTNERGRFSYVAPSGPSRLIRFVHRNTAGLVATAKARLRVAASATLDAKPRRLRNGERMRLIGELRGRPVPRRGVLVEVQAWLRDERRWETFGTTRSDGRGRFGLRYRFTSTTRTRTYKFRARVPRQAAYPYAAGGSRAVSVRVHR